MKLRVHGASEVGLVREHNEDSFLVDVAHRFFAVADGLGGLPGGEVASQTAIASLREQLASRKDLAPLDLGKLVAVAHTAVRLAARSFPPEGIGTTLTALCLEEGRARFVHVGDSFAFLVRGGVCRPITREHNIENERTSIADLAPYPPGYRYALTRVVGTPEPVRPDFFQEDLQTGDHLVLATDGLTDLLDVTAIASLCAKHGDPAVVVRELIASALERGGHDNITAIVIVIDEP